MRYVVYGAGAVGGAIGGRLFEHGSDVVLVARGAHHDALVEGGLELQSPDGTVTLPVPVVDRPAALTFGADDVVVLAMKTQDTAAALRELADAVPEPVPVVCAQNGVENERLALRLFPDVLGICVMLPSAHLEPGVVQASSSPVTGILDIGRYPSGVDALAERIAADLDASSFSSRPEPDIMRVKRGKLLMNLGNALEAAGGSGARGSALWERAKAEALTCFAAAGLDATSDEEDRARRGDLLTMRPIDGQRRGGGSTWQSLARGTGSIETDHLNGEIVLLGRQHGVPTPVNALLQQVARRLSHDRAPPGSLSVDELEAALLASRPPVH